MGGDPRRATLTSSGIVSAFWFLQWQGMPHTAEVVVMRLTTEKVLKEQFDFLLELDRLKSVVRQSSSADGSRRDSAEHSWHLVMFALVLSEYADVEVNAAHAANLLLVHDIVEIDAGDAPIHASGVSKTELEAAERKAAERIFGLLPAEQAARLRDMWLEFDAGQSAEARFAKAIDFNRCCSTLKWAVGHGGKTV